MAHYRAGLGIVMVAMVGCVQTRSHPPAPAAVARGAPTETSSPPATIASTPAPVPKAVRAPAPSQVAAAKQPAPKSGAATRPTPTPTPASTPAPPAPAVPTAAPLDLVSLEQRLKDTKAIGVFTKLSLKNQVDDLLGAFRDFHAKKGSETLAQLRQQYDLLVLKVLSVLQDGDPDLAAAIARSREAIWGILADPVRFSKL